MSSCARAARSLLLTLRRATNSKFLLLREAALYDYVTVKHVFRLPFKSYTVKSVVLYISTLQQMCYKFHMFYNNLTFKWLKAKTQPIKYKYVILQII